MLAIAATGPGVARTEEMDGHPTLFTDDGACPGEGCSYGIWHVEHDTALLAAPEQDARVVAQLHAGEAVTALTGFVTTRPARFVVKRDRDGYRRGESFWVYTYLGEGYFKIWRAGRMQEADLGFSPYGGTAGDRCQDSTRLSWGELDRPLQMTWWFKIRDGQNVEGWSKDYESLCEEKWCG
jgi:hypothetical protein